MTYRLPSSSAMKPVEMDASLANDVGLHHTLSTALADLIDNSIDAGATEVLVRFLLEGSRPIGVQVIDDGHGMDRQDLERALTYAGHRDYDDAALGHFGVGLKAASVSQADVALVCSVRDGATPVGARLERSGERQAPRVGPLETADVESVLASCGLSGGRAGTVVQWSDVRTFTSSADPDEQNRWTTETKDSLRRELGLVFHRIIATGRTRIEMDTFDVDLGFPGLVTSIEPTDPFGYRRSGHSTYPQELDLAMADGSRPVRATAHIWPSRSQSEAFNLGGRKGVDSQGLFVYRRDRLIQIGGWSGIVSPRPEWELARVSVDLDDEATEHARINPEKSGVVFSSDLRRAFETSTTAVTQATFSEYLAAAGGTERDGRRRTRRDITALPPGTGLAGPVRTAFEDALTLSDDDPVEIRWKIIDPEEFFRVDRDARTLWLNLRYREALTGRKSRDVDDAPVVKALVHLLVNDMFEGSYPGAREKLKTEAWNAVLSTAALVQMGER
ncbi:ATP-binding protein [Dermacoccus abyssi]